MHVNEGEENDEERCVLVSCNLIGDRSLLFDILLIYMNFCQHFDRIIYVICCVMCRCS